MTEEMESPVDDLEAEVTQDADDELGDGAKGNRTPIYTKLGD